MKTELNELIEAIKNRGSHVLIVSGNVYDHISFGPQTFADLRELIVTLTSKKFTQCLSYDLFSGINVIRGDENAIVKAMGLRQEKSKESDDAVMKMLQQAQMTSGSSNFPSDPMAVFLCFDRFFEKTDKPAALIIDYAETVIPGQANAPTRQADQMLSIALTKWSRNQKMRANGHLIVLIVRHKEELGEMLLDRCFETARIRFPKPSESERYDLLAARDCKPPEARILAKATAGLSAKEIVNSIDGSKKKSLNEAVEDVFRLKQTILKDEYGDLLEIMQPKMGFESIGGLEKQIAKLKETAKAVRDGNSSLAPQGILFMGPPGTGKTVLAEAFAKEAGLNFVRPLDIKSKWVGESERRMSRFLNALKDLAPVVVFIDEFDQNQSQRGSFDGDSGTSRGLFKKMLEIMSDTSLRGKVLWIMATNRPDLIDPAMKRPGRCDLRIPFLSPSVKQLELICQAAFHQYPDMKTEIMRWKTYAEKCEGYSGADMIEIIRRAWERANIQNRNKITNDDMLWACEDYKPQIIDRPMVCLMSLLALIECSSKSLLPDDWGEAVADNIEELTGSRPKTIGDLSSAIVKKALNSPNTN